MKLKSIIKSVLNIISSLNVSKGQKAETLAKKLTVISVLRKELVEAEKVCKKLLKAKGITETIYVDETEQKVSLETKEIRSFDTWPIALAFSDKKKMRKFVDLVSIQSGRFEKVLEDEKELLKIIDENTTITKQDSVIVRKFSKEDKVNAIAS